MKFSTCLHNRLQLRDIWKQTVRNRCEAGRDLYVRFHSGMTYLLFLSSTQFSSVFSSPSDSQRTSHTNQIQKYIFYKSSSTPLSSNNSLLLLNQFSVAYMECVHIYLHANIISVCLFCLNNINSLAFKHSRIFKITLFRKKLRTLYNYFKNKISF